MNEPAPPSWNNPAPPALPAKKILTRIGPLKLGIMMGATYALMSLIFIPFLLLATLIPALAQTHNANASGSAAQNALPFLFSGIFIVIFPVIYGVMGFIAGVIMAAVYNLVARFVGGIEVTVQDAPA